MPFLQTIQTALVNYDQQKGLFRKLFGDQSAINALRQLSDADQGDLLKNYQCFLDHAPSPSQASYQVYQAVLDEIYKVHPGRKKSLDEALAKYDQQKGMRRRIFGDHPAINALRKLSAADQLDPSKIFQCIAKHIPKKAQASYQVYETVIKLLPRYAAVLHTAGCLTQENFDAVRQHANFPSVVLMLKDLHYAGCLTQENFKAVCQHGNLVVLASALNILHDGRCLNQKSFNAIREHSDPVALANALKMLHGVECLNQEIFNAIREHSDPVALANALSILHGEECLNQENFNAVRRHGDPVALANALSILHGAECLNQENLNVLRQHGDPVVLANALNILHGAKCLTQENRNSVFQHCDPLGLANAVKTLHLAKRLTNENFNALQQHANPLALANGLNILYRARCLTEENRNAVCQCKNPQSLARALAAGATLQMANRALRCSANHVEKVRMLLFLSDASEANLISENQNILTHHVHRRSLNRALKSIYDAKCLTQENFNVLSQHANPEVFSFALAYLNGAGCLTQEIFNILSQHQKPEELACALLSLHYVKNLTQENSIALSQHAEPPRKLAEVLECLRDAGRLNQANLNLLLNPAHSFLLTEHAVETVWRKIPKQLLTQAVFKQLIEKSKGIHPDREVLSIVKQTFARLHIVVREEAMSYLSSKSKPQNKEGLNVFVGLIDKIKKDGLEAIWKYIKNVVTDRLFNDFGNRYPEGKDSADFSAFIDSGKGNNLDEKDLNSFQSSLQASKGYHKYCSTMLRQSRLFSSVQSLKENKEPPKLTSEQKTSLKV